MLFLFLGTLTIIVQVHCDLLSTIYASRQSNIILHPNSPKEITHDEFSWYYKNMKKEKRIHEVTKSCTEDVSSTFAMKINFKCSTYSLQLTNLSKEDSGNYTAIYRNHSIMVQRIVYQLVVQDPVRNLTLVFDEHFRCNFMLNCSVHSGTDYTLKLQINGKIMSTSTGTYLKYLHSLSPGNKSSAVCTAVNKVNNITRNISLKCNQENLQGSILYMLMTVMPILLYNL
ncbi:uncharacterized protein LOC120518941 [Polypterus senegalus]|uniref:uncharacterized protein LOC120518941 n=1 Tax=Polypterus senegalus TaxID=55291 RepID=UPI001964A993|nr:uncharacterized protein LOC120518941 [Polypterus senegalus]